MFVRARGAVTGHALLRRFPGEAASLRSRRPVGRHQEVPESAWSKRAVERNVLARSIERGAACASPVARSDQAERPGEIEPTFGRFCRAETTTAVRGALVRADRWRPGDNEIRRAIGESSRERFKFRRRASECRCALRSRIGGDDDVGMIRRPGARSASSMRPMQASTSVSDAASAGRRSPLRAAVRRAH